MVEYLELYTVLQLLHIGETTKNDLIRTHTGSPRKNTFQGFNLQPVEHTTLLLHRGAYCTRFSRPQLFTLLLSRGCSSTADHTSSAE